MKTVCLLLCTLSLALATPVSKPLNFEVDAEWNLVPDGDGNMHLMHKTQIFDEEIESKFTASSDVVFILYTQGNQNGQIVTLEDGQSLSGSNFNPGHQTRFIIHGWNNDRNSAINTEIRQAYLQKGQFNVFVVDWGAGANTANYISARNRVNEVGPVVARFIDFAVRNHGLPSSSISIVGHSLGGHTAGIAGKNTGSGKVRTIVGLDPAGPLFSTGATNERINSGDANYVEIMHTNGWTLGFGEPLADADFFPNGGRSQPGCGADLTGACAHGRAPTYFAESINSNRFNGRPCLFGEVESGNCSPGGNGASMGGEPSNYGKGVSGVFHLTTNSNSPFAKG